MPDVLQHNPFEHAPFLGQLKEHKTAVIVDYDRTLTTGNRNPNQQELSDQEDIWRITRQANAVDGCISARTPGMMMDTERYMASAANGYGELLPRLHKDPATDRYQYRDPATIPFYKNAVNRKIIGSFGWGILVEDGKGYRVDKTYEQMLSLDVPLKQKVNGSNVQGFVDLSAPPVSELEVPSTWRLAAMTFIVEHCLRFRGHLAPIESIERYHEMKTDVAPPPYRTQFDFVGRAGHAKLLELKKIIRRQKELINLFALRLHTIDESRINEEDPEQSRYTLYMVPWYGRKENMFNWMLKQCTSAARLAPSDMNLFYAGDSLTDLKVGLWGGGDARVQFVLPAGSVLAPYLVGRRKKYGVVDLSFLWANPIIKRLEPRLMPTGRSGEYRFVLRARGGRQNTLVIADERYPNLTPPGSVAAFLEEYLLKRK